MSSLEETDKAAAAVAKAPRVELKDIEGAIGARCDTLAAALWPADAPIKCPPPLMTMCLCVLVMKSGYVVIGKSAAASPENFDRELGKKFAYEDAIRQLWPLMAFSLKDRLADQALANQAAMKTATSQPAKK